MSDKRKIPELSEAAHTDTCPKTNPAAIAAFVVLMIAVAVFVTVVSNYINKPTPVEAAYNSSSASIDESAYGTVAARAAEPTVISDTYEASKQYIFPADINLVSMEQLTEIHGIGEKTAESIISYRSAVGKIRNMDLLLEIDGIGKKTLEKLKEYLYVSADDYLDITTTAAKVTTIVSPSVSTSLVTTTAVKSPQTRTATTTTAATAQMSMVNINTATVEELAECLLLNDTIAQKIIELRSSIQYFSKALELLYVEGFTEAMLLERMPYIVLED